ncbi:D-3-phosphoglycerate dehydrogenase [Kitasatospora sp. MAA4]|uniref:hydroxyacid dehydrogenase n=1 Tax=Kitasatospora sp. MAA4 TaxID=3035093 RepID=UPI0024762A29|nr:hydroxyacid dehydrogenase [Kitasatospora sp. MAA4]MDH6136739.1 D-3-phosphoglycerate dehydrogenase [Kitasatospora sp. MAA4]
MPKPIVLVADPLPAHVLADLEPDFDLRHCEGADRVALLAAVPTAAALLIRSATKVDQEVLDAAPLLRVVARAGVGLDNVDITAATRAGVRVANAPQSNVVSVAELTVGLMISMARTIPAASASVHAGQWKRAAFQGVELAGKTAGILGFGKVGRLVATRLQALDMRIVAHDPFVPADAMAQVGVLPVELAELMRESDFLTIHLPLTAQTRGIVGEAELALAKSSLRLLNTARGGIVDEFALAQALKENRLAGAALDVFEVEPPESSPLLGIDSVIATPHIGAGTPEAQERAGQEAVRAVRFALTGQDVPGAVN